MRYIKKSSVEPDCMREYKAECRRLRVAEPLLYKDFNRSSELKAVLCREQQNVCCYCQRSVKGFRIEHSYPENGPDKSKSVSLQLDYSNLFASCIDSQRRPPELQYCDVAKGNKVIREFIKECNCQHYFRYLSTGEIIPNGRFYTLSEYTAAASSLPKDEKDALDAIQTLNLNCPTLKEERKQCIDILLTLLNKKSEEEWEQTINSWLKTDTLPPYIELRIQYITNYINRQPPAMETLA